MPTPTSITAKIGSFNVASGDLFAPTVVEVVLTVDYCGQSEFPARAQDVYFDVVAAGYVIEVYRPLGVPSGGPTPTTEILGVPANTQNSTAPTAETGFEVTEYEITRDESSVGIYYVRIRNEMVEYQQYNHASVTSSMMTRPASIFRANPNLPTLATGDDAGLVNDPLDAYDMNTSIGGRSVDINTQPVTSPIAGTLFTYECVIRKPYYIGADSTALTTDPMYTYYTQGEGANLSGGRFEEAPRLLGGGNTGENAYEPVVESVRLSPITGSFVRLSITMRVDDELNLTQIPLSLNGAIPEAVDGYGGTGLGFRIVQCKSVGFMDTFPRIAQWDHTQLPENVLEIWQSFTGGS